MENIEVMVVLFIIVVLGYAMCKLGYMGDKFDQKLSSIVIDITCPALILSSVMYNTPRFSDRHNYGGMTRNRYICKKEENQNGKTI